MGCTMKGIAPKPTAVVIHLRVLSATCGAARARPNREAAQMRLMVKPTCKLSLSFFILNRRTQATSFDYLV